MRGHNMSNDEKICSNCACHRVCDIVVPINQILSEKVQIITGGRGQIFTILAENCECYTSDGSNFKDDE